MQKSILGAWGGGSVGGAGGVGAQVVFCILIEQNDRLPLHYISNERAIILGGSRDGFPRCIYSASHGGLKARLCRARCERGCAPSVMDVAY